MAWNIDYYQRLDTRNPCSLIFVSVLNTLDIFTLFITRV
jgi:hypothetical protein